MQVVLLELVMLIGDFVCAAALVGVVNWLGLIPFRRAKGLHWTERARRLYPARLTAASSIWLIPADMALGQRLLWPEATPPWLAVGLAGWLGTMAVTYFFDMEVYPWITAREWLHQALAAWTLRFAWWFLFFGMMAIMPEELGWCTWVLGATLVVAYAAWAAGGLIWCCRQLRLLEAPPERLRRIVAEVSARMKLPVRGVWLLRSTAATAFALPYTGELLFSERLLRLLSDDEVAAICAHELGHISESKSTLSRRLIGLTAFLPWLFIKPLMHVWGIAAFFLLGVFSWLVLFYSRHLGRHLETRADEIAHAHEGDPGTYARALSRLHEENLIPAVLPRRRHAHPDLYDRLLAVGVQPDYPRPEPASAMGHFGVLFAILFGFLIVITFADNFGKPEDSASPSNDSGVMQPRYESNFDFARPMGKIAREFGNSIAHEAATNRPSPTTNFILRSIEP